MKVQEIKDTKKYLEISMQGLMKMMLAIGFANRAVRRVAYAHMLTNIMYQHFCLVNYQYENPSIKIHLQECFGCRRKNEH